MVWKNTYYMQYTWIYVFRVMSIADGAHSLVQGIYTCMPPIHALASYDVMMSVIAAISDKR